MRHRNVRFQIRVEQICPGRRRINTQFIQKLHIRAEAESANVDARPVAIGIFQVGRNGFRCRRLVLLKQTFLFCSDESISRTTPPD